MTCALQASRRGVIGSLVQVELEGHVLRVEQVDSAMGAASNQDLAEPEAGAVKGHPGLTHMSHHQHWHIQFVLRDLEPPK